MLTVKKHMKKFIFILPVIIIAVTLLIWKFNDRIEYNYKIESFVLINDIPYMVSEGTAYYWDDGNGAWIACKEGVKELFRGEYFCILKEDGSLEMGIEPDIDEESGSNGGMYSVTQANKLLDISQDTPIRTLNTEMVNENCWALCEDGSMLIDPGEEYIPFGIQNEIIKDISGYFILTEEGNVYEIENWHFGEYSYRQISEDKIIAIDACSSDTFCVGIREDHTVVMWLVRGSTWNLLDFTDWKNVKEIAAGFNYCVGLTMNGKVLYADYDKDREAEVSKRLKGIKAEHITCCFETIAIIKSDLTVEKIWLTQD